MSRFETVEAYLQYEQAMTEEEFSSHMREDSPLELQDAWPDYLDYIDEWQFLYEQRLNNTVKDFIYDRLVQRRMVIKCQDHLHQFLRPGHHISGESDPSSTFDVASSTSGSDRSSNSSSALRFENEPLSVRSQPMRYVYLDKPDTYIDTNACWFQTIVRADNYLLRNDPSASAARLSVPEALLIKRATQLQLMLKDGTTHAQLSFEEFKKCWWGCPSTSRAMEIFNQSETPLVTPMDTIVQQVQEELCIPSHSDTTQTVSRDEKIVLSKGEVAADHGLHSLLRSAQQPRVILSLISEIRRRVSAEHALDEEAILSSVQSCPDCTERPSPYPSHPIIIYAPPGNGKSTAVQKELFVGVDTDWLISGSTFNTVIKPFLDRGIAVITNQHSLVPLSGYRLFGTFNRNHLKTDAAGKQYTTLTEIVSAQRVHGDDMYILYNEKDEYVSDTILALTRANYIYEMSKQTIQNRGMIIKRTPPPSWKPATLSQFKSRLETWIKETAKQKRAKRSKFKKKHKFVLR